MANDSSNRIKESNNKKPPMMRNDHTVVDSVFTFTYMYSKYTPTGYQSTSLHT